MAGKMSDAAQPGNFNELHHGSHMTEASNMFSNRSKNLVAAVGVLLVALVIGLAGGESAHAARVNCGTFTVQHNDRIKTVQFPKGQYNVSANKLSCKQAIKLLKEFLQDPDQILRQPWTVNKNRKFARGKGSRVNFKLTPLG